MNSLPTRRAFAAFLAMAGVFGAAHAHASPRLLNNESTERQVRLVFSEPLVARRCTFGLTDAGGRRPVLRVRFSANVRAVTVTPVRRLPPGVYHFTWSVMGRRGPPAEGSFDLTVQ